MQAREELAMKIGWDRSSIRLRVTPEEVERLSRGGAVNEDVTLPWGGHWSAAIVPSEGAATCVTLEGGRLRLFLAHADQVRLAEPEAARLDFGISNGQAKGADTDSPTRRCSGGCAGCRAKRQDAAAPETTAATAGEPPLLLRYVIEKDLSVLPAPAREALQPAFLAGVRVPSTVVPTTAASQF
jgi:hypothetical protein